MKKHLNISDNQQYLIPPHLKNDKSGFFDLPNSDICDSPEHNPPSHLHIPQGKGYRHICPKCGKKTILIPPQIQF